MTTHSAEGLLPCPHCGGAAKMATESLDERDGYGYVVRIRCETCGATVPVSNERDRSGWNNEPADSTKQRAIAAWNRRELCRADPAGSREVEQMAKRLDDARAIEEETSGLEDTIDAMRTAAALLRKLQQPAEEDAYVIEQMGRLLAEIAIIVNGPEPALTKWSYHDLPEKVRKLQQGAGEGREG